MTPPNGGRPTDYDREFRLRAARGEIDTDRALMAVRTMHATRTRWEPGDPALGAALDEGDARHPDDDRRWPASDVAPWDVEVDVDPATQAAFAKLCGDRLRRLDDTHAVFVRWLGRDYDTDSLDVMLATLAAERLDGDPLWLMIVSGSGNAKTETVAAAVGAGALVVSTVSSEGALLSGSPKRDKAKDATGGLLRRIGPAGVLVIKDMTSILSMHRDMRAAVLAALREIYDGYWSRNLGVDGGRTLTWQGRIVVIGAVTTAWDRAHAAIASMGDRFVLVRTDSTSARVAAGRRAVRNTGDEVRMRGELASAVGRVLVGIAPGPDFTVTEEETDRLLAAADLVTLARTAVDHDYRGDVIDAHAPEMPTRFAKQLAQIVRGALALGMDRQVALRLALRCARDSMPPLRLGLLDDVAAHPGSTVRDVRRRLNKPKTTVDRGLQDLHMLGVLTCDEIDMGHGQGTRWLYRLAEGIDPGALAVPEKSPHGCSDTEKGGVCSE